MKKNILAITWLLISSCSYNSAIGLKDHVAGLQPRKIIIFQIAGLAFEHRVFSRFNEQDKKFQNFDNAICMGQAWDNNLYDIRINPWVGFQMQLTGKPSANGSCDDFKSKMIWSYLDWQKGFKSAYFENQSDSNNTMAMALKCGEDKFIDDAGIFIASNALQAEVQKSHKNKIKPYHFTGTEELSNGFIYYDKSCQDNKCHTSFYGNTVSLFERYFKNQSKYVFIVRDFHFSNLIKMKKMKEAITFYTEIEKTLNQIISKVDLSETLILVTSSSSLPLEFPDKGDSWMSDDKLASSVVYKKTSLISPIYAFGARSENFCGSMKSEEIFNRIFINKKKLSFDLNLL